MQASDTLPGFHIVIRNNLSYSNVESDIPTNLQTDGEGIILDLFDYADPVIARIHAVRAEETSSRTT